MGRRILILAAFIYTLFSFNLLLFGEEEIIWGPTEYSIKKSGLFSATDTFSSVQTGTGFKMRVVNGDSQGSNKVTYGAVWLNGNQVVSGLDSQTGTIERDIQLYSSNEIRVEIDGQRGSFISIAITRPIVVTADVSVDLTALSESILAGQATTLTWTSVNADTVYELTTYMTQLLVGAELVGNVTDSQSGAPVGGALVTAVYASTTQSATTASDGSYFLEQLPIDEPVEITVSRTGYLSESVNRTFTSNSRYRLDFLLFNESVRAQVTGTVYDARTLAPEADVKVAHLSATTRNFSLTGKPRTGDLEGTVTDKTSGNPVTGATLTVNGTALTAVTDGLGYYKLMGAPAGLVDITVSGGGYPAVVKTAAVEAYKDAVTPVARTFDFTLSGVPAPENTVSKTITAVDGGFVTSLDNGFSLAIPPGKLSGDAVLTITTASTIDGLTLQPGEPLDLDPALGTAPVRVVSRMIKVSVTPVNAADPAPSIDGLIVVAGWYSQVNVDNGSVDEESVFPYFYDGIRWTALQVKGDEGVVDKINNITVSVLNPNLTETDAAVDSGGNYLFVFCGTEKASETPLKSGESGSYPSNVRLYDKDELNAVQVHKDNNSIFYPNPNALPMIFFHGWDRWTVACNYDGMDPNTDERYNQMVKDFVEFTNGVYRPAVISYNSRPGIMSIGAETAATLHSEYLNQPSGLIGLPADGDSGSGTFPYIDAFCVCAGGVYARCYQAYGGKIHNMIHMATPNHGTFKIVVSEIERIMDTTYPEPEGIDVWLLMAGYLYVNSPGTYQLIDYDDRVALSQSTNPQLQMLNANNASIPHRDLLLIAGTDDAGIGDKIFGGDNPNDGIVTVDSVFNCTSDPTDDIRASLFDKLGIKGEMSRFLAGFNHRNMGRAEFSIALFKERILMGLSDWAVAQVHEENASAPLEQRDNYVKFPTLLEPGAARARIWVQYNVWDSQTYGPYKGRDSRDIDRVTVVLYYLDGNNEWKIADTDTNGAYPDGSLREVKPVVGNSFDKGRHEFIIFVEFPRVTTGDLSTEVMEIKTVMIPLRPGQETVPLAPEAHFGMPEEK